MEAHIEQDIVQTGNFSYKIDNSKISITLVSSEKDSVNGLSLADWILVYNPKIEVRVDESDSIVVELIKG